MAWNDNLSGESLSIAESDERVIRVIAGPGTGKTYSLKKRIARFLEEGVDPERILVITFTRVAARDLELEIEGLNIVGANRIQKGTLHSFCLSLLMQDNVLDLINRTPRMLFDFEKRFLIEDLGSELFGTVKQRKKMLTAFEAAWAREQNQEPGWPEDEIDREFNQALINWLRFHKSMLVGELIPVTLRYLRDNPTAKIFNQFDHILVDEYQDLNKSEQSLIDLLSKRCDVFVIGDEDQSIYESLRHAHPEGISKFHLTHEETVDFPLNICRRCPKNIVKIANELIRQNSARFDRRLFEHPINQDGSIQIIQWESLDEEVEGIVNFIRQKIESGDYIPGELLVLTQRRQIGYRIRDRLNEYHIQAHSFFREELLSGNPKSSEDCQILEKFALLLLLFDQSDAVALRCWVGFGSQSLMKRSYKRLMDFCYENRVEPYQALCNVANGEFQIPYIKPLLDRFRLLLQRISEMNGLNASQIFDSLFPIEDPSYETIREVVEKSIDEDNWNLEQIIETIKQNAIQREVPTNVEFVRIMSLQKSKGLTAKDVVILSCNQGLIPQIFDNLSTDEEDRKIEEQRRLFYVAITRATDSLVISSFRKLSFRMAKQMNVYIGSGNRYGVVETIASTFINDLGSDAPQTKSGKELI